MKFNIIYAEFNSTYSTFVYASSEESAIRILKDDLGFITILEIKKCLE